MKKILSLLLILVVFVGLCACGSTEAIPPQDESNLPQTPNGEDAPRVPEEIPETDYSAATFDWVRQYGIGSKNWDGSLPLTTTGEEITCGLCTGDLVTDYERNDLTLWLQEQTGVKITVHEFSAENYAAQVSLLLTGGGDMPDILSTKGISAATRAGLLAEGCFLNCAGYMITDSYYFGQALEKACMNDENRLRLMLDSIQLSCTDGSTGEVYGPASVVDDPASSVCTQTMINIRWLEKLNLQAPATLEEFYTVLVAFRDQDPNGNGLKDEIPMMAMRDSSGRGYENYLLTPFIPYITGRKTWAQDGVCYSPYDRDEYRQALQFVNRLVQDGLLDPGSFTATQSDLRRLLNPEDGSPAVVGIACALITEDYLPDSRAIYDYEPLAALQPATALGGSSLFEGPAVENNWAICWNCKNPLLAWRLLDFMCSPEATLRQCFGQRGVDWDWIEDTPYKDKAAGNGIYGGNAAFVLYRQDVRPNSRWADCNVYRNGQDLQLFVDPDAADPVSAAYRKAAANTALQQEAGSPAEELSVILRTPEEEARYQAYNTQLTAFVRRAKNEFAIGVRDPYSDGDWAAYLQELEDLHYTEIWVGLAQSAYDRAQAAGE